MNKPTFVTKDGVIKEQIFKEEKASNEWGEKWGFVNNFEKLCLEVAAKRGISEQEYKRMTMARMKHRRGNSRNSSSLGKERDVGTEEEMGKAAECDVKSSGPVPKTTSGLIGWKSASYNLEKIPMYVSPRHTLQPPGSEPPAPYNCIMLG